MAKCLLCGYKADTLHDIKNRPNMKVVDKMFINEICIRWYEKGYKPLDAICPECFTK